MSVCWGWTENFCGTKQSSISGRAHASPRAIGRAGIASTVVNLDVIKEPLISTHDVVRYGATLSLDVYRRLLEKFGADTAKVQELQRRFKGIKDKTFVQYDGRKIPFADGSFDHVLALWSTYQIPRGERAEVFRELMRVGKHIHIGPIGKVDFTMLMQLAQTQGFDVVACESMYIRDMKRRIGLGVRMKTPSDYQAYMRSRPAGDRIREPLIDDLTFTIPGVGTRLLHPISGGSTIILKKKEGFMGEQNADIQYIGEGKPEEFKPIEGGVGETHPAEPFDKTQGKGAVKRAVAGWWERVGPGGVEKSWVTAHRNILANIKETERFAAFEKTAETWRRVGKALGIASTVVDFSLSGVGLVVAGYGLKFPQRAEDGVEGLASFFGLWKRYDKWRDLHNTEDEKVTLSDFKRVEKIGRVGALSLGAASAEIGLGVGPAHVTWRLGAKVAEFFGVAVAKAENYVGTGKAAQHAEALGEVLDKGFKVIAKNPEIVPEKYRKTVEIPRAAKKKNRRRLQRIQEKASFQRDTKRGWMGWTRGYRVIIN